MTKTEKNVVDKLIKNSNYTAEEIAGELQLTKRTIERNLISLQSKGIIERIGSKKMGRWKVNNF